MDFFESQEVARRHTRRLAVLFALGVVAVSLAGWLAIGSMLWIGLIWSKLEASAEAAELPGYWAFLTEWRLVAATAGGTLTVIVFGSLYKMAELRGGGRVLAERLGGRRVEPASDAPGDRRLLNVVEEMAIAAGAPVPPVYVMDEEAGINAFAAGHTSSDAVIGVTRGAVERLDRDELQGVIAHEFSHLVHGDTRINLRLIGWVHGILAIALIGQLVVRGGTAMMVAQRHRRSREGGGGLAVIAAGVILLVVGYVGLFIARVIKASISRQREFLADAAAVQYTRDPSGIAGALKKIGGLGRAGARIENGEAEELSHMYFGRSPSPMDPFDGLLKTHPPLAERIRRIEPGFDGTFPERVGAAGAGPGSGAGLASGFDEGGAHAVGAGTAGEAAGEAAAGASGGAAGGAAGGAGTAAAGATRASSPVARAAGAIRAIDPELVASAREPYGARAVVYALLLDEAVRDRQEAALQEAAEAPVQELTGRLEAKCRALDVALRLPLLELAMPALRELSEAQYRGFRACVHELIRADDRVGLFEWVLQRMLLRQLDPLFGKRSAVGVKHRSLKPVASDCAVLLCTLAWAGHGEEAAAEAAFEAARRQLSFPALQMVPPKLCGLEALDRALGRLEASTLGIRRRVLEACAAAVASDGRIAPRERQLLRGIADALGCPVPEVDEADVEPQNA